MRLPRWMHKLYADANGYFWIPCPICGRMIGGHEKLASYNYAPGSGKAMCAHHSLYLESRPRPNGGSLVRVFVDGRKMAEYVEPALGEYVEPALFVHPLQRSF